MLSNHASIAFASVNVARSSGVKNLDGTLWGDRIARMKETVDSPSGDALRQVVDDSMQGRPIDRTYLVSLVLERYVFHAKRHARTIGDRPVLPKPFTTTVASAVWLDATGSAIAPSVANRTPTLTSIGQYLSRLARVATDPDRGLDLLSTAARFNDAEARANASGKFRIEKFKDVAFESFENKLTSEERQAIKTVRRVVREHERFADLIIRSLIDNQN